MTVYASSWTGTAGWRSTYHFGFRSKKQLPFFMVWRLDYGSPASDNVVYGSVLFNSQDWIGF